MLFIWVIMASTSAATADPAPGLLPALFPSLSPPCGNLSSIVRVVQTGETSGGGVVTTTGQAGGSGASNCVQKGPGGASVRLGVVNAAVMVTGASVGDSSFGSNITAGSDVINTPTGQTSGTTTTGTGHTRGTAVTAGLANANAAGRVKTLLTGLKLSKLPASLTSAGSGATASKTGFKFSGVGNSTFGVALNGSTTIELPSLELPKLNLD